MTVLVAGGTGRLGKVVVRRLVQRGEEVRVLTRDATRARHLGAGVEVTLGDVRDAASLGPAVAGAATVVSAVHGFVGPDQVSPASVDRDGNRNLVDAVRAEGADLVLMSMVGASVDNPFELARMKYAAERYAASSGVGTTVVRSTAFLELWIDILRQTSGRSGRPLVFGRGDNPINFVSVEDVGALVVSVVEDPRTRGKTFEIAGPADVTFNELALAVQVASASGRGPRHVPRRALSLLVGTVGRVNSQLGRQMRSALVMDSEDLRFRGADVRTAFRDVPSTPMAEVLASQ